MTVLRRIGAWLRSLFRRQLRPGLPAAGAWRAMVGEEFPESFEPRVLYLVGEDGDYWFAGMLCPCGCGDAIQLSLLENDCPSWRLSLGPNELPTLRPSVWRRMGCRSRFFLSNGEIRWASQYQA